MLILGGAVAASPPATVVQPAPATPVYGPPAPPPTRKKTARAADATCPATDTRDIVVCAQRRQPYRVDPNVIEAERGAARAEASATAPVPVAQASCSASPMGCGSGLEGLDWVNVAAVVGTAAVRAAKGEDWTKAFKPGGPDEYQLYLQAEQRRRDAHEAELAQAAAARAREAEGNRP